MKNKKHECYCIFIFNIIVENYYCPKNASILSRRGEVVFRVEPDTRLKRVSGTDKALLSSTSIIRVIRVNICARIE